MLCGNTYALDRHMEEVSSKERLLDMFTEDCEEYFSEISDAILNLQRKVKFYDVEYGQDFTDELNRMLRDLI